MFAVWVKCYRLETEGRITKDQAGAMFQLGMIPGANLAMLLMPPYVKPLFRKRT